MPLRRHTGSPQRLLILSSSTGGGHDMRARSLTRWADKLGGWQVTTHQALEHTHPVYRLGVETYNWIQRTAPWLHHVYFNYLEVVGTFRYARRILGRQRFVDTLRAARPDVIVSVHPCTNHGFFDIARRTIPDVRCVTYCGELSDGYGFSRDWASPDVDLFIGATAETCDAAATRGVPETRRCVGGFLLDPDFYQPPLSGPERRRVLADELHLDPDIFTLLIGTGGVGANNHLAFLDALRRSGLRVQVIVLCGTNEAAWLGVTAWARCQSTVTVRPLRYTREMARWIQISSAIVARPGTGTTSEAIQSGCPMIHNGLGGIMPQEWITVKYAWRHGISETVRKASQLPGIVRLWMEEPSRLQQVRDRMRVALPAGTPPEIISRLSPSSACSHLN